MKHFSNNLTQTQTDCVVLQEAQLISVSVLISGFLLIIQSTTEMYVAIDNTRYHSLMLPLK